MLSRQILETEEVLDCSGPVAKRSVGHFLRMVFPVIFGVSCALGWHFIHGVSETYQLSLSDPHFWFHLVVEITIGLYAGWLFFITRLLLKRFRHR